MDDTQGNAGDMTTGAPPPPASAAPPLSPPMAPAPAYTTPAYPPPVPTPPTSSGRTAGLVIAIVAGALILIGALAVALFFVGRSALEVITAEPENVPISDVPVADGDAGDPVAVNPVECPDRCFTGASVGDTISSDEEFATLGVGTEVDPWGTYDDSSPQAEFGYAASTWATREGSPDECFFTMFSTPVAVPYDQRPGVLTDTIHFTGFRTSADELSSLDQSVRIFDTSANAVDHMTSLHSQIANCTHYDIGTGADYWTADVTPTPALTLPDSVAAVGWTEDSPFGRYYVVDLQRGNLVQRTLLFTGGGITEAQFDRYLEGQAVQLATLEPKVG